MLTPDHKAFLNGSGITDSVLDRLGVHSVSARGELPEGLEWSTTLANTPGIVFPWPQVDGTEKFQLRPDEPGMAGDRPAKYVWPKGETPALGVFRVPDSPTRVLIVEGTKQSLAAASCADDDTAVYGIAGCRMWLSDGVPTPDLYVVDGMDVLVCLDADTATNLDVYNAAVQLGEACTMEGASSVRYVRLPAGKKAGLDDVLGKRPEARREAFLARLLEGAKPKPADTKPKPGPKPKAITPAQARMAAEAEGHVDVDTGPGRGTIIVNDDPYVVINDITRELKDRWDGRELFNHGGVLSLLETDRLIVVQRGEFLDLLQKTARTVKVTVDPVSHERFEDYAWPDVNVILAASSKVREYTQLDSVVRTPYARPDGTLVMVPGYDPQTRTILIVDDSLKSVSVPEEPTSEDVQGAVKLLMEEWLGDFPFPAEADRANMLGLILTAVMRSSFDIVPVCVVNGLQMGVGKNLLADVFAIVVTGSSSNPLPYNTVDEELRKVITSAFRSGLELLIFDECHSVEGASFARSVTAPNYSDRLLGGNDMVAYPNRVTWMTLGNQVQVKGDMARRTYEVALRTKDPNPQDRKSTSFRHADLKAWTREHRAELVSAVLTLVRAWHVAGKPVTPSSFGSFEAWERTIRGVLEVAGVKGFLDNLKDFRSETSFDRAYWEEHLGWLWRTFGEKEFTAGEARERLERGKGRPDTEFPPGLEDPTETSYTRKLGQAYHGQRDKWYGPYRLVKAGQHRGNAAKWMVVNSGHVQEPGHAGTEGTPITRAHKEKTSSPQTAHDDTQLFPVYKEAGPLHAVPAVPALEGVRCSPDEADPLTHLLSTANVTPTEVSVCECGAETALVPPHNFWYACPACHPSTFDRS